MDTTLDDRPERPEDAEPRGLAELIPGPFWEELSSRGQRLTYPTGALLWEPGHARIYTMYMVAEGLVRLYQPNYKGRAITILAVGPGGVLGFHPQLLGCPYAAGAEVIAPSTLLAFSEPQVRGWFAAQPSFRTWMVHDLDLHLMNTYTRLELEHTPAKERVARALLALDAQELLVGVSRGQLADLTNLSTETVVRVLSSFLREGVLRRTRFTSLSEGERRGLSSLLTVFEPLSAPYL